MIRKLGNDKKVGNAHIRILYPGVAFKNSKDTGLGTIGRIDHAQLAGGVTIKMHPHINDDILSYFRTGYAQHIDSEGFEAEVSRHKLMLMKAGKTIVLKTGNETSCLKTFMAKEIKLAISRA